MLRSGAFLRPWTKADRGRWLPLACAIASGCAVATARLPESHDTHPRPAGIVQLRWRSQIHESPLFEAPPEECATGALAGSDLLVIGSRGASIVGLSTASGQVVWADKVSAGIDGVARYDAGRGQVYVGTDEGVLHAVDPHQGAIRWSFHGKGSIDEAPEIGANALYVATSADRLFDLDPRTGVARWQYERDTPDGFTVHGYSAPRLTGNHVVAGFADGTLVSLDAASGEVIWAKSLASVSEQFVDVDATPIVTADTIFAASYSGGLFALDPKDGSTRWRLSIEGAGSAALVGDRLLFATPRQGLHAVTRDGQILWRQGLSDAGDVSAPMVFDRYLIISASRAGILFVDKDDGRLLEVFNPGHGICARATLDPENRRLYVLSNGGSVYGLDLN